MRTPAIDIARVFLESETQPFIVDAIRGRQFTYGEALALAIGAADALAEKGVRRGDRIGLLLGNGAEFALLYLACIARGYIAVPINNSLALRDRSFILEKSGIRLLLTDQEVEAGVPVLRVAPCGETSADGGGLPFVAGDFQHGIEALRGLDADSILSINFTSGTTSLPKGVVHRASCLIANAEAFDRQFGLSRESRFLHVMPMAYMAGFLNTLLCPMVVGAPVVLAPQFGAASALRFWDVVSRTGADTMWLSPTMLATLCRVDRGITGKDFCRSRAIRLFSCTAPLPLTIRREFEEKYAVSVVESYGLSELLLLTANAGACGTKDGAVGLPLRDVKVRILDVDGRELQVGGEGDIVVETPYRSVGYLDYENGMPSLDPDPSFDTGDIGRLDADGYLFVTGRKKDLIIRGGFNISPRAIEELLSTHALVDSVAVVGAPHPFYGEEVVAAILPRDGAQLAEFEPQLRALCREQLGDVSTPDRFVAVAEMPLNTTGKIQKNILRSQVGKAGAR